MAKVDTIEIVDAGRYYTTAPTIIIDPPDYDSDRFGGELDSSNFKFGGVSLKHDSNDLTTLDPVTDSIGAAALTFTMQSFWFYLDSLQPCTLTWNEKFRVFVDNNNNLAIAYVVDSSQRDGFQTDNVQVRDTQTLFVQKNKWHFAKIETYSNSLRIGLDSAYTGSYVSGFSVGDNYLYDSGDVIRIGYDSGYTGPNFKESILGQYVYDSDINKSFVGNIDNFQLTIKTGKTTYADPWSNWVPDSAEETYEYQVPMLWETFDFKQAKGVAVLDSFGGISKITITDSGDGYDSSQEIGVTFVGGHTVDSDYSIGDTVEQTLSSGVKMSGEIQRVVLDSAGDSSRCYYLAHVGADDGKYHTFVADSALPPFTTGTLINTTNSSINGLMITAVTEDNKISETEQNETFSTTSDDFLDFSENNPFGDPENQ